MFALPIFKGNHSVRDAHSFCFGQEFASVFVKEGDNIVTNRTLQSRQVFPKKDEVSSADIIRIKKSLWTSVKR